MRNSLPDPELSLRDAADFILNSGLGRKALACTALPRFPIFLRDLITTIDRLSAACHLVEFTDHGLPHLCSLVDRISRWSLATTVSEYSHLLELINEDEAAVLLIATLVHDIGMLSQKPEDLVVDQSDWKAKGQMDIPTWVRKTHVERLEKLVRRLFDDSHEYRELISSEYITQALNIAKAHSKWPWESGFINLPERERGLAAVLAVADLLDEDSSRCDTSVLIRHRQGNMLNIAHWLRHSMTANRVLITGGCVDVRIVRPPNTGGKIAPVIAALRNHYRLVLLYNDSLAAIGVVPITVSFEPQNGSPSQETIELEGWQNIAGLATEEALVFHLLKSFFPLGLLDTRREIHANLQKVAGLNMEFIELNAFHKFHGRVEIHSPFEQEFLAILNEPER